MASETARPVQSFLSQLRRSADFSGRSTRSDLAWFYLVTMILTASIGFGVEQVSDFEAGRIASTLVGLGFLCPWASLAVRRIHDVGRTGWWLLLAVPTVSLNLWDDWARFQDRFAVPVQATLPSLFLFTIGVPTIGLLILLVWQDDPNTNRFGPNPRYSPAGEAA